jgi:cytochrome c553
MRAVSLFGLLLLLAFPAWAEHTPEWAYPPVPAHQPSPDPALISVPGSTQRFTQGQIDGGYDVADWYPDEHPPMPQVVAKGGKPPVRACAMCHLPNGNGHPENAGLAGLPVAYLIGQMHAYVSGQRSGPRAASMVPIAKNMSAEDMLASAEYFAALRPGPWTRIVETETVPQTYLGLGAVRYRGPGGGTEALGARIISVPENDALGERRDSHTGFVEYVPPGSVARGKTLVEQGVGGINCKTCHGRSLTGRGEIPGLAGRLALVMFRGVNDIGLGHRATAGAVAMRAAMPALNQEEMIAVAAYLATLPPVPPPPAACVLRAPC